MRGFLVAVALALGVIACGPPNGGLTEAQALSAARIAQPDATGVVSARMGQMREFDTEQQLVAGDRWVWAVVVTGTFPFSCGPAPLPGESPHPCPSPATTRTVILDYRSGQFLESFGQSGT